MLKQPKKKYYITIGISPQHYDVLDIQEVVKLIVTKRDVKTDVIFYCSSDMLFHIYMKLIYLLDMVVESVC